MASTPSGGGLLANVQRQLAQGRSDEEILAGLTAGGLSLTSATRFLDRARPAGAAPASVLPASAVPPPLPIALPVPSLGLPPPVPSAVPSTVAPQAPAAPGTMVAAAAAPAGRSGPKISWVVVVGGAVIVVLGTFAATRDRQPARVGTAAPSQQSQVQRIAAPSPGREATIARHLYTLAGGGKDDICVAASELARLEAREHVAAIEDALSTAKSDDEKGCVAHELVRLGETDAMLAQYLQWSQGDSDALRRHAVVGFGYIGPPAALQALPVLKHVLASNPTAERRFLVVLTLTRLGPEAWPMLRPLAADEDPQVRTVAQRALEPPR